jgi:hypothetical protein
MPNRPMSKPTHPDLLNTAAVFEFPAGLDDKARGKLNAELQIAGFARARNLPSVWICKGRYKDLRAARHAFRNVFHVCGRDLPRAVIIPFYELSELP